MIGYLQSHVLVLHGILQNNVIMLRDYYSHIHIKVFVTSHKTHYRLNVHSTNRDEDSEKRQRIESENEG
jgi:hypothetical protein